MPLQTKQQSLCVSVTFDRAYLEPAIVTLYEIWNAKSEYIEEIAGILILTEMDYLDRNLEQDLDLLRSLMLSTNIDGKCIKVILVHDKLPQIKVHHFNNVVIHKLLAPTYLESGINLQVNLDAGFLIGDRFDNLLSHCLDQFVKADNAFIGLLGEDSKQLLPKRFIESTKLNYYPKGGLLFIKREIYHSKQINQRILRNYTEFLGELVYPDQELLSICLESDEAIRLSDLEPQSIFIRYLWPDHPVREQASILRCEDFALYKNAGLLKPWQYFVQDPEKSLFVYRRNFVGQKVPLDNNSSIETARGLIPRKDLLIVGQKLYEGQLQNRYIEFTKSANGN